MRGQLLCGARVQLSDIDARDPEKWLKLLADWVVGGFFYGWDDESAPMAVDDEGWTELVRGKDASLFGRVEGGVAHIRGIQTSDGKIEWCNCHQGNLITYLTVMGVKNA